MATLWRYVVKGVFQNKIDEGRQAAVDPVACQKYWWTNILYINNFYPNDINTNTVSKNDVHVSRLQLYLPLIHFTILRIYSYQLKTCNFAQLLLPPTNEVAGR